MKQDTSSMSNEVATVAPEIEELNDRVIALTDAGESRAIALRKIIDQVEFKLRSMDEDLGENPFPLAHEFAEGLYMRSLYLPAGAFGVGRRHRFSHFTFISVGDISVLTDEGTVRLQGPHTFRSPAGVKRVVYAHSDTIWSTVHSTDLTDVDSIVKDITDPVLSMAELEAS